MKKALIILALLLATVSAFSADADKGIVTVYMPSPAGLANKLAADFEAKTGIEVRTFQGTTGEILARLETEKANPVADVVILASWSDGLSMKESGQLESYVPANADKMVPGWIDDDSTLFGYSASAVGVIYNTLIYPTLDADWDELAAPEYKDDIAIPDPELSGACKDFVAGYVNAYGWDTFEALAANGMIVPGANKAALEAVTRYMAADMGADGIRVNALSSGPIRTLAASGIKDFQKMLSHARDVSPLRTTITLEDIGRTAAFLLSDYARGITAETVYVDGGFQAMAGQVQHKEETEE